MKRALGTIFSFTPVFVSAAFTALSVFPSIFQGLFKIIPASVVLLAPGFYVTSMMKKRYHMNLDEFIVVDFTLSGLVLLFCYVFLSMVAGSVTGTLLWLVLSVWVLASALIDYMSDAVSGAEVDVNKELLFLSAFIVCYLPSMLVISKFIPAQYWRGSDAWGTYSVVRTLLSRTMSPQSLVSYFESFVFLYNFGYYYLLSAFSLVTGFTIDSILRYGGILQSALLAMLTYIAVKRKLGPLYGLVASSFLFFNPLIIVRFVTPIRESFSTLLLIFVIYFTELTKSSEHQYRPLNIFVYAFSLTGALIIHPLTSLFIVGVYFFESLDHYLKGSYDGLYDFIVSMVASGLTVGAFFPYVYYPFSSFIDKSFNVESIVFILSIISVGFIIMFFVKKYDYIKIIRLHSVRFALITFMVSVLLLTLFYPPRFGVEYNYGYMQMSNFSHLFFVLALIGFYGFVSNSVPLPISAVSVMIVFSFILGYLNVQVPILRLEVYLIWVMTYSFAYLFKLIEIPLVMNISLPQLRFKDALGSFVGWCKSNRFLLLLFLVVLYSSVSQVYGSRQFNPVFSSYEVDSARAFVERLKPGEIVYSPDESEILIHYLDIPRSNIVHDFEKKSELTSIFGTSSPYYISDLVHRIYPNATMLDICLQSYDSFKYGEEPIGSVFDNYTINAIYGSTYVYSLKIPFTLEDTPLSKVRFIKEEGAGPVIPEGGAGSWDESLASVSNCVVESGEPYPFKMLYVGVDRNGVSGLGLVFSRDGVTWGKLTGPVHVGDYRYLYLVKDELKYYLFAESIRSLSIVRLESCDGYEWSNETTLFPLRCADSLRVQEAPVVWYENQTWNMLFWETYTAGYNFTNELVYATSHDCLSWGIARGSVDWHLVDSSYRPHEYQKILPFDIVKTDGGVLVLARYLLKDGAKAEWKVGSLFLAKNIHSAVAHMNSYVFEGFNSTMVDSVHVIRNPLTNRTQFFYADYSGAHRQGLNGGVYLGFISDHGHSASGPSTEP